MRGPQIGGYFSGIVKRGDGLGEVALPRQQDVLGAAGEIGLVLLRERRNREGVVDDRPHSRQNDIPDEEGIKTCGPLDAKAIFFYASLFPAFVDVGQATSGQFAAVIVLTAVAVGFPKLAYARLASSVSLRPGFGRYGVPIRKIAGIGVLGTGVLILTKSP